LEQLKIQLRKFVNFFSWNAHQVHQPVIWSS
jgi:hypothetical protein